MSHYQYIRGLLVIFGSATFVAAVSNNLGAPYTAVIALVVTISSAISLVMEPNRKARLHDDLAKRFITLEREMIEHPTGDDLNRFIAQRLTIEADEPPTLNVITLLAHNELSRAMGYDPADLYRLRWYHRPLGNVKKFRVDSIMTNKEWEEKAKERSRRHSLVKNRANDKVGAQ